MKMPKSRKPLLPTRQPGDSKAFNNANDMLESIGVRYSRPTRYQLKIGKINYYPATGKTHIDGYSKAQSKRGLEALKALLLDQRMRLGVYVAKRLVEAETRDREQLERDIEASQANSPKPAVMSAASATRAADDAKTEEVDIGLGQLVLGDAA
jgi:hypothetical protein